MAGCDAFFDQQYRDAVVDAIDEPAIAGHEGLAQGICLTGVIDPLDRAAADRLVEYIQPTSLEHCQWLAGGSAGKDVEELAVHGDAVERRGR